ADTPATGSLLQTTPLVTAHGTITFAGEVRPTSDPEFAAAGSVGDVFDIVGTNSDATLMFDFDVTSFEFIYGGNSGSILVEALDAGGNVVDSFFQASTDAGEPAGPAVLSGFGIRSVTWTDPGFSFAALDNIVIDGGGNTSIGVTYCNPSVPNSSGLPGTMSATGSNIASDNNLLVIASQVPDGEFAYMITSRTQGFVANPGGSQGHLCVLGNIARFNRAGEVGAIAGGQFSLQLPMTDFPEPPLLGVTVLAGDTWNFQCWHRDFVNGMPTSNFTNGLSVQFQ
ncbi:MAG: hypothetical protein ACI8QC_003883, partial [Planctomycetota bacterium]